MICSSFYLLAIGARCPAITLLGRLSAKPSNKAMCKPPHKSLMESLSSESGERVLPDATSPLIVPLTGEWMLIDSPPIGLIESDYQLSDWLRLENRFWSYETDVLSIEKFPIYRLMSGILCVWCVCYTSMRLNAGEHKRSFRIMTQEGRGMIFCSELFSVYGVMNGTHGHLGKSGSLRRPNAMATLGIPLGRRWAGGREIP